MVNNRLVNSFASQIYSSRLYVFLNKRHPILPCTSVEQSSRHMTFEFFEWNIACFQVVRVRKTLSSSTESKLFCFVWPMEDSSSYEVRERIIQVVHVGEMILSLEINWTESFWLQGWDELNLSLRLFTCVSVLYITPASTEFDCCKISISYIPFVENQRCELEHSSADMLVKKSLLRL